MLHELRDRPPARGSFYSVNFPHLAAGDPEPEIVHCPLDPHPLPLDYRHETESGYHYVGDYHNRPRNDGTDVDVCFRGKIAVTLLKLL